MEYFTHSAYWKFHLGLGMEHFRLKNKADVADFNVSMSLVSSTSVNLFSTDHSTTVSPFWSLLLCLHIT